MCTDFSVNSNNKNLGQATCMQIFLLTDTIFIYSNMCQYFYKLIQYMKFNMYIFFYKRHLRLMTCTYTSYGQIHQYLKLDNTCVDFFLQTDTMISEFCPCCCNETTITACLTTASPVLSCSGQVFSFYQPFYTLLNNNRAGQEPWFEHLCALYTTN